MAKYKVILYSRPVAHTSLVVEASGFEEAEKLATKQAMDNPDFTYGTVDPREISLFTVIQLS